MSQFPLNLVKKRIPKQLLLNFQIDQKHHHDLYSYQYEKSIFFHLFQGPQHRSQIASGYGLAKVLFTIAFECQFNDRILMLTVDDRHRVALSQHAAGEIEIDEMHADQQDATTLLQ